MEEIIRTLSHNHQLKIEWFFNQVQFTLLNKETNLETHQVLPMDHLHDYKIVQLLDYMIKEVGV